VLPAGLLATIAAGCPVIERLLQQQQQQQLQQQQQKQNKTGKQQANTGQQLDKQEQYDMCTTLLQLAACHLQLWANLAWNTHHSIGSSSSSSMRSILGSTPLLQTVQPVARLAAELLLWPGVDGEPCWTVPLRAADELCCALYVEINCMTIEEQQAATRWLSSSSSSSSGSVDAADTGGVAVAAAQLPSSTSTQPPGSPWVHLMHCPAVMTGYT
jgi:hypothetical protein